MTPAELIATLEDLLEFDPTPQEVIEVAKTHLAQMVIASDPAPEKKTRKPRQQRPKAPSDIPEFEAFWKAYPRRQGANPKAPAIKAYRSAIAAGAIHGATISGVISF
jgi:hypothetical protein